ncbi:MAG: hypothetical protein Q4C25_07370 [Bacillota bacterium]|nr:hypothetical protein [Bacillota bacterium]
MDYKKQLIEKVESFYVDVVEEFKEAELQIAADSRFKSIFKKKNYDGNIEKLKDCKKTALSIDVDDEKVSASDEDTKEVARRLERCLVMFNGLCDAYIQLQVALKKKAEKEALKFSEYKEIFNKMQACKVSLNGALHDLDLVYTDYAYEEGDDPYNFLSGDSD